jgi:hypothetical protein
MSASGIRVLVFAGLAMLVLPRCGSDEEAEPLERSEAGCGTTDFSICGYAFDDLEDEVGRPAYTSRFSSALMRWGDDERCAQGGQGVRGECEDGKQFLFFRFGDTSEVRYYDAAGVPIAVALMSAESSSCGDPCPRESFYGTLEDVHCDEPEIGGLCGRMQSVETSDLPFAQGTPLVACEECAP